MKRKKLLIGSFFTALACVAGGVGMVIPKNAVVANAAAETKTVEQVSLVMKNGASVRYASSATDSGIRFSVNLSKADYLGLEANEGNVYSSVSYGMIIMPYSYLATYGELTEENLFSDSAKYDWAQWNGSEWVKLVGVLAKSGVEINLLGVVDFARKNGPAVAWYADGFQLTTEEGDWEVPLAGGVNLESFKRVGDMTLDSLAGDYDVGGQGFSILVR